jgi:cytochrome c oxidase assembly factor CtaG
MENMVSATTTDPHQQGATAPPGRRQWLAVAGLLLVLACLLPPLVLLAHRYVFAESIQFTVFAMAGPALIVLGAPWRFLRLSGLASRLAAERRARRSIMRAAAVLAVFFAVCLFWRLIPVVDALSRQPALVLLEAVTLLLAGTALWLELVPSPPVEPRLPRPQRALIAALAMWSTWAVAYVLGFSSHGLFSAYDVAGSGPGAVGDQEIAVALVWAVAGFCFVPVVIVTMLGWLTSGEGPDEEFQRIFRDDQDRAAVRGWGGARPTARRPAARTGARQSRSRPVPRS